jgi:hypothetical protein
MSTVSAKHSSSHSLPSTEFASSWAKKSLVVGLLGIGVALALLFMNADDTRAYHGWMIGLIFWLGISIGLLLLTMIHYIFDAGWSVILRRQYEHALAAIPWLALGALPLLLAGYIGNDPGVVWVWMNPDAQVVASPAHHGVSTVSHDALYLSKEAFLNKDFFTIRTVIYLVVFVVFAQLMRCFSFRLDQDGNARWVHLARKFSAAGAVLVGLSLSFLAFDWIMSINYHWFSTMFGVWFFAASIRAALALAIIIYAVHSTRGVLKGLGNTSHLYLMASLLLAFTMFWAYVTFSQYFLIYSANIPEETFWYVIREKSGWWTIGLVIVFGGFFTPFFSLLSNKIKLKWKGMIYVSAWVLLMTVIDLYYNILPRKIYDSNPENLYGYTVPHFGVTWIDVATLIGFGGLFFWAYFSSLARQKVIPLHDPRILESIQYQK